MRKTRRRTFALLIPVALLPLAGCVFHAGRMASTKAALAQHYPEARFERELALNLGPGLLSTAAWLSGGFLPPEQRVYGRYLLNLDHLTIGIYKVSDLPERFGAEPIAHLLPEDWHTLVKVRAEDEFVWIGHRRGRRILRDLYILTLSEDELVLLRLEGDLDDVLADVLARHDVFSMMDDRVQNVDDGS